MYSLPLIPQLQQLFRIEHVAKEMKRPSSTALDIPSATETDNIFLSKKFSEIITDPLCSHLTDLRTIFLRLGIDGINPFGKSVHSMWPVVLQVRFRLRMCDLVLR